jgi:hypothetical protein
MEEKKQNLKIDHISFQLGMINCFAEMVASGVKKLALSPPFLPEDYKKIENASKDIVSGFNIKFYLEKSLLITDLQNEDFTKGKWSILYYKKDEVLEKYFELKRVKEELQSDGHYDKAAGTEVSRDFMRLLSYPEENIEEILSRPNPKSPYMLIDKNGID